jgi:hypothetical protein
VGGGAIWFAGLVVPCLVRLLVGGWLVGWFVVWLFVRAGGWLLGLLDALISGWLAS